MIKDSSNINRHKFNCTGNKFLTYVERIRHINKCRALFEAPIDRPMQQISVYMYGVWIDLYVMLLPINLYGNFLPITFKPRYSAAFETKHIHFTEIKIL